ncbi:AAA family ATPase [Dyella ginsengisoli]|uniref:AAA family ATPase n=1 Tax=Dyella ginsengisoli TaxID=363848 RepID=UPI00034C46EE|nr:AAA family ATPase [Dyella ginsengisoli]
MSAATSTRASFANELAAEGFRVFRCRPRSKQPAAKRWPDVATNNADTVREWFADDSHNIGVYAGERIVGSLTRHMVVLDLDTKGGKDGPAALRALAAPHGGLPDTFTIRTPSGGLHLYFHASRATGSNAGVLAPGIDVRGVGGYVVGPGSEVEGGTYTVAEAQRPADCPAWLEALLPHPWAKPGERGTRAALPGIDPERARVRAVEYLTALDTVTEGGRNHAAFAAAARVKDLGCDPDECLALMLEHWPCEPMLDADELQQTIASAYLNGQNPQGADAPEAQFEAVEVEPRKSRYKVATVSDLLSQPRPAWLVRGLLPARGLGVVYGAPGSGKSFLMLDLAAAIARGIAWAGQRVRRGRVVYVGLEGAMRARVEAYLQHHELQASHLSGLDIIERQGVDLLAERAQDAKDLVADIKTGDPVSLVVVDTLNRAMPGGNENASEDMGKAIRCAGLIASSLNCLCVFVHHSGKDSSAGARGHSSLLGAADAELEISRAGVDNSTRYLRATKVKDGEDGARFSFRLATIDLGPTHAHDPDADPLERDSSCVVVDLQKAELSPGTSSRKWTPLRRNVYGALSSLLANTFAEVGDVATCSVTEWQNAYFEATPLPDEDDPKAARKAKDGRRKNFTDARDWLVGEKLVATVTKKGVTAYRLTGAS